MAQRKAERPQPPAIIQSRQARSMTAQDFDAVLALNEASVHFLSAMDRARLELLHAQAALSEVVEGDGQVAAFILAFREGSAYDSINYRWFVQRYPRFLYVDRIVVADGLRSKGTATLLYRRVFEAAARDAVPWVTCEFDVDPPNPVSQRFHARFGFTEVGRQRYGAANKAVALQAAAVGGVSAS
jgi:predicted GNAT superfamily acetyltransferase